MIMKDSRYATCIIYKDGSGDTLSIRQRINSQPRFDDRYHTVIDGDRLDLLAYRYLGDARLWWIICDYNDIFFPLELTPGQILRIPSIEHVQMNIFD